MPLKAVLDTLEGLSEELAPLYEERDGKFILSVEPVAGYALENSEALRKTLQKTRDQVAKAEAKLKTFADLDPDSAREALKKMDELASWDPEKKIQEGMRAREQQLLDKYTKELKGKEERISVLTGQLEDLLVTQAATKAISDRKGVVDLLLPHVKSQIRMRANEHGRYITEVIDPSEGIARLSTKLGSSEPMTIDELVENLQRSPVFARAFEGSGASGSGSNPQGPGASTSQRDRIILSKTEAKDPNRYRQAKEAAAKQGQSVQILAE